MNPSQNTSSEVSLDVGGFGFDLRCYDALLAGWLARRYRHFPPVNDKRFKAEIRIRSTGQTASLLQQPMHFSQGVLTWDVPGCQGSIDPFQRRGNLALTSNQPQAEAEYFLRLACALLAFEAGGLLFHAAGVVQKGRAHAFFGCSGSGKSTVARFSPNDAVLNDDLLLLMPYQRQWWAYPTPFWNLPGEAGVAFPAPLAGLYSLVQDTQVYLQPLQGASATAEMLASSPVVSADPGRSVALIQRCRAILAKTPAYRLHFLPDTSFWQIISAL
jgi:hypothetical protein